MATGPFVITTYDSNANTGPQRTIGSAKKLFTVTANTDFGSVARGIWVGVAGNANVVFADGTNLIIPLQAGPNPIECIQINSSGTTATGLFFFI